jgi:uncharacterized membrane protein
LLLKPPLSQPQRGVEHIPANFDSNVYRVKSKHDGYLQAIDNEELMKLACKHDLLLRLNYRPGKFVIQNSEWITVYPRERVTRKLLKKLDNTLILGRKRTEQQDVEFSIEQLVEIALRALSPSLNDLFTAIRCLDRLAAGLSRLAQRNFPSSYRYDNKGNLRVIAESVTFAELVDTAFNQREFDEVKKKQEVEQTNLLVQGREQVFEANRYRQSIQQKD